MTIYYNQAVPCTSAAQQAHILYQWLTYCCQFPIVETSGTWSTTKTGADGIISSIAPTHFLTATASFINAPAPTGDVNRYIAIRDSSHPENTVIAKIVSVVNSFDVILSSSAIFSTSSTGVSYRVFDPQNSPPSVSNYFVISNLVGSTPLWNVHCQLNATPSVAWTFGPIGGWDALAHAWIMPTCTTCFMRSTVTTSHCVADPSNGWIFTWCENTTNRNGVWLGSLTPLHAPNIVGAPTDSYYSAIFGATSTANVNNFSRATTSSDNLSVGESMASDTTIIPIYMAQKRLLSSATDVETFVSAINPRSSESDDYDFVAFHRSPNAGWRGKVTGLRLTNDNIANRTAISAGATYVIEDGIGVVWNGSSIVP